MTDERIIELYREGETQKAFSGIIDKYSERLYWHIRRIVLSHEDADDLLQEVYIKVWTSLPSFRQESGLFTWLFRIATNETLNFLRRKRIRSALLFKPLSSDAENLIDSDPYFNGDEAQKALIKAISHLPEKQRLVFSMRHFDDLKYEEISEILGVTVGSLKASYHIAYEKIKNSLLNL